MLKFSTKIRRKSFGPKNKHYLMVDVVFIVKILLPDGRRSGREREIVGARMKERQRGEKERYN